MKRFFFFCMLLIVAGTAMATRYYVVGDDRAIPMSADTRIMSNTEPMLWIRDWGDQSLTCNWETSSEAGPSGYTYAMFTPHADNGGNVGGYYGITWAINNTLDLSAITENWKMVIVVKTNVPFWTVGVVDGDKCTIDLAALVTNKDNQTWQTIEVPMYDIFDKGISFATPFTGGYLFNLLTNDNTAASQLCIDEWYFTDGEETALENVKSDAKATKVVEDGQLIIIKNGVRYNVLGAQL